MRKHIVISFGMLTIMFCSFCKTSFVQAWDNNNSIRQLAAESSAFDMDFYAQSDIMFYKPECYKTTKFGGNCGGDITSENAYDRMKEVTRKYGTLAMNLQITYGVPWEFILGQMGPESTVGTKGIAATQAKDGKFNWMGLSCFSTPCPAKYGNHNNGEYPRPKNEGSWYESYDSIELMLKSYASGDFARNGHYDDAFKYTDKDNYDLTKYAVSAFTVYVGRQMSEGDWYVQTTFDYIKNGIRPVAEELGWPTSEELQKQNNIEIGGKFPIGTPKGEVYDDSVSCGSTDTSESDGSEEFPTSGPTCANLAEKRQKMWNDASDADKGHFMYVVYQENDSLAGVEGFMNQAIARSDGDLNKWINGLCPRFRGGASCSGSHTITSKEQKYIDKALSGSNVTNFATGNSSWSKSAGDAGTGGHLSCLWVNGDNEDGGKCKSDIDYSESPYNEGGNCSKMIKAAGGDINSGWECWSWDNTKEWNETMAQNCVSGDCAKGEFVYYSQYDPKWTDLPYGGYGTIGSGGCGPTSFAMLATVLLAESITPDETTKIAGDAGQHDPNCGGSCHTITKVLAEHYGLEYKNLTDDEGLKKMNNTERIAVINKYLKDGWMIHTSGAGDHPFSSGGHYIGIRELTSNGKWLLADSGHEEEYSTKEWDPEVVMKANHRNDGDNIHAIRNTSSGNCNTDSVCGRDNGGDGPVGEEGLNIEQAKQFMMSYGENKNDSSKNVVGSSLWNMCNGGGSNCVTFSAFFMKKFTTISDPPDGKWGDGQQVVGKLKSRSNVDATFGTEPRVYAILSTPIQHTAVVLGHYDGKWIIGHANCKYEGIGKGNGGDGTISNTSKGWGNGDGSGFIAIEDSDDPADWQLVKSGYSFAYPTNVDTVKIEEYLKNGE